MEEGDVAVDETRGEEGGYCERGEW